MGGTFRRAVVVLVTLLALTGGLAHAGPSARMNMEAGVTYGADTPTGPTRSLTVDDRVAARRAVEEVLWRHRIWPRDNPGPKPPLDAVLSDAAIRSRVEDSLRESNALERLWDRPITAGQLQAEMDRMVKFSRDPAMLREVFAALGDDPFLIAECLVRPALSDRLLRDWYAFDSRFHAGARRNAEEAAGRIGAPIGSSDDLRLAAAGSGARYAEASWRLEEADPAGSPAGYLDPADHPLAREEWDSLTKRLEEQLGGAAHAGLVSPLQESAESFFVTSILERGRDSIRVASLAWPKQTFEEWWAGQAGLLPSDLVPPASEYRRTVPGAGTCTDDTWAPTMQEYPDPRSKMTAVWTGTEMIVWGGSDYFGVAQNTGGRYNPATDTWVVTGTGASVPSPRYDHTAIWTGTEMIVWGGTDGSSYLGTGGRYDPSTDTWVPTSTSSPAPGPRSSHTAVWTNGKMLVWGGTDGSYLDTGGAYAPPTDTWTATPVSGAPSPRAEHSAVWTNGEMIVWGGTGSSGPLKTGARLKPSTGVWTATSEVNGPVARTNHTAVWTGTQMIVWGGRAGFDGLQTGGRYTPATDSWIATSTGPGVPSAREAHTAVWTGTQMIIWGGNELVPTFDTGARYTPASDSWTAISTGANAPSSRTNHAAVWTGAEMIVWGGEDQFRPQSLGARYNPAGDTWAPVSMGTNVPSPRGQHTAVWTGVEMIIWGGLDGSVGSDSTGGRYYPATDSWSATSTGANVPSPRTSHTMIWTGTEAIVWGGFGAGVSTNTGGRYDPVADSWLPTGTSGAPIGRNSHTAVWTGTEMIVWGGCCTNTGGRYNPSTDTWMPTSLGANVPSSRDRHTAVWTGSEMIVWGGFASSPAGGTNTGGRYDPATDNWTPTGTGANVPAGRDLHVAVWTGTEMIVWGGEAGILNLTNTGGRYDPATDSWTPTGMLANLPSSRYFTTGVWTGEEMIVWGGAGYDPGTGNTGGRYSPVTDLWRATSTGANVPIPRDGHTAVATGTQMIVWGRDTGASSTGGLYCYAPCSPPTGVPGLVANPLSGGVAGLSWSAVGGADSYDLVRGSVQVLRSGGGDFSAATGACLANDTPSTSFDDVDLPAAGDAFWYLIRPVSCGNGTYDSGAPSQAGPRDPGIAASAGACS